MDQSDLDPIGGAGDALAVTAPLGGQLLSLLRKRIVRGALEPGRRLSEQDIARAYGLSRQPVREAFIALAGEGLLEVRPQRGTYVRKIALDEVETSRFVREAVEAGVVRLLAARPDPAILADLEAQVARQAQIPAGDAQGFMELDEAFHQSLAQAAGYAGAWAHLQPIKLQMDRVRHLTAAEMPRARLVAQHRAIVAAVAAADPGAAEAAMRTHLRGVLDDLPSIAAARPEYFEGPRRTGPTPPRETSR